MSSDELEVLLFKNKLNEKTIIDLLSKLSSKTIEYLIRDLKNQTTVKNEEIDKDDKKTNNTNKNTDKFNLEGKLYIFSDGGCLKNGSKNAKAGYSVFFTEDNKSPYYKFNSTKLIKNEEEGVTNNQAELRGIRKIFKIISDEITSNLFKNKEIIICTDSMYSINCITKWVKTWSKNGWVNSKKEPVKNKELIQDIVELSNKIEKNGGIVTFRHIFSHLREPSNKDSLEWQFWNGNRIVDENINLIMHKKIN